MGNNFWWSLSVTSSYSSSNIWCAQVTSIRYSNPTALENNLSYESDVSLAQISCSHHHNFVGHGRTLFDQKAVEYVTCVSRCSLLSHFTSFTFEASDYHGMDFLPIFFVSWYWSECVMCSSISMFCIFIFITLTLWLSCSWFWSTANKSFIQFVPWYFRG